MLLNVIYTREEITKHQATATTIDKEKIDRKWPASSGRQFCVVLESLNFLELSALFIWRMPNDQIY